MTPKQSQIAHRKTIVFFVIFIVLLNASFGLGQNFGDYPWQYFWQKSLSTNAQKDYAGFLENARTAVEKAPANHPTLTYNLARAYSLKR